jgi:uncharacterized small protein (DUF1192 family)
MAGSGGGGQVRRRRRTGASFYLTAMGACLALAGASPALADAAPVVAQAASPPRAAASPADPSQDLRRRLEALEAEIERLQNEIAQLKASPPAPGQGTAASPSVAELQKRVTALTREVQTLKQSLPGGAGGAGEDPERSAAGLDPAASKPYFARRGVTIGGYGSFLYENFTTSRDDDTPANEPSRATLEQAFLTFGYRYDAHWLFNSSIGIEDAVAGDGQNGDATVEFAYVDYNHRKEFGARGGLLLLPLGFLNERHAPNSFLGTLRPQVEQRIIPTTWREIGGGVYGTAGPVEWRAYLTTGLDASGFAEADGVAGGRQQGAEALAADLAVSARVDWTPLRAQKTGTLLVGASGFTGESGQQVAGFPSGRFTVWDAHASYRWQGLWVRALAAFGILSDAGEISLAIDGTGATAIAERMAGWYLEVGYDVFQLHKGTGQALVPFCRYESLNTQHQVAPGFTADPANDLTVKNCGVAWNPIPQVRVTADATNYDNQAQSAVDQINLALGWTF